ncbi:MAG: thiamine biosynthesis protein ThiS [Candidatus Brocadia sp. UTAMX1]|jgi:thiamine biosynthesis protein ThiS|nr:MAG: thiamine biosynthesis protein ThiS [Candidatus Brocadia sp. UTAMX1]
MRIILNGETKECPEGITIERLLDLYKIDKNRVVVELNLHVIPGKELSTRILRESDVLEAVTFVGGG